MKRSQTRNKARRQLCRARSQQYERDICEAEPEIVEWIHEGWLKLQNTDPSPQVIAS
jgi:hypothetical protein